MHARVMKRAAWHLSFIAIISTRRPAPAFHRKRAGGGYETQTPRAASLQRKKWKQRKNRLAGIARRSRHAARYLSLIKFELPKKALNVYMLTETKEATEAARGPLHVYSYRANYIHTHAEEASQ